MEYKVGDRVIRTYPNGTIKKGIIVVFDINCVLHYMAKSLEDEDVHWNIDDEIITMDVQYYREERLKQLLG